MASSLRHKKGTAYGISIYRILGTFEFPFRSEHRNIHVTKAMPVQIFSKFFLRCPTFTDYYRPGPLLRYWGFSQLLAVRPLLEGKSQPAAPTLLRSGNVSLTIGDGTGGKNHLSRKKAVAH